MYIQIKRIIDCTTNAVPSSLRPSLSIAVGIDGGGAVRRPALADEAGRLPGLQLVKRDLVPVLGPAKSFQQQLMVGGKT